MKEMLKTLALTEKESIKWKNAYVVPPDPRIHNKFCSNQKRCVECMHRYYSMNLDNGIQLLLHMPKKQKANGSIKYFFFLFISSAHRAHLPINFIKPTFNRSCSLHGHSELYVSIDPSPQYSISNCRS